MDVVVLTEKTAEVAPAATDKAEVVEPIWTAGYWTSITSRDAPPTNPATAEDYPKLGGLSGAAAAVDNCASHLERRARIVRPSLVMQNRSLIFFLTRNPSPSQTSASRTAAPRSGWSLRVA